MKLRKRIGAWVLAGAMMATVGAQALAYQSTSGWSGYLGSNKYTFVTNKITEKDNDATSHVNWTGSNNNYNNPIYFRLYRTDGTVTGSVQIVTRRTSYSSFSTSTVKNEQYRLQAKLTNYSLNGLLNSGSWEP